MKFLIYSLVFVAILTGFIFLLPTPAVENPHNKTTIDSTTDNTFVLTNVTVFDGQTWHQDSQLVINNGRISTDAVSNDKLPRIDGGQGFVIPGLIDAHTHTWGNALQQALQFGVTTEIDMFTALSFAQQAKLTRDSEAKTNQADFFSAGTLVTSPGGHGNQYGFPIPTINSVDEADEFVQARIDEGSDFIKIVYNHEPDYHGLTTISKQTLAAVIKASHARQKLAVVHISNHQSAVDAVTAGADGLVHTFGDRIISDELLTAMREKQVFVIPTLSVIASMAQSDHSAALSVDKNLTRKLSTSMLAEIKNGLKPFHGLPSRPDLLATAIENTRIMHEHGIIILAGSDAPNPGTAHGISLHGELELLQQAGLSPTEVLQAAGYLTAQAFPIGRRGDLSPGAKADFIVLSADPREHIKNTRTIVSIWKNGYPITSEDTTNTDSIEPIDEQPNTLISHFNQDSLKSFFDSDYKVTSDQMMQGNSTAAVSWTPNACDGGGIAVKGHIKNGFNYPWSGVFLPFSANMNKARSLTDYQAIEFEAAGDVGVYQLMVFTVNNMQPVQIPFKITEQCRLVAVTMSDHPSVNWDAVTGLAWVADGSRLKPELASFAFSLDNVVIR